MLAAIMNMLPKNWKILTEEESLKFSEELQKEVGEAHSLYGVSARAIARHEKLDDFLFETPSPITPYVVVHLTWHKESSPKWPSTEGFSSLADFEKNGHERLYE